MPISHPMRGTQPSRWGASDMTFPPWLRLLLSLPALIPPWLVCRTVLALIQDGAPGDPFLDIWLAVLGVLLAPLALWYLRDLWRINPARRQADREAEREAARIARAFARERANGRDIRAGGDTP